MMGLLKNETWDDYINKKVYVTKDNGTTGFSGYVRDHNEAFILVEDDEGIQHEVESEYVYGTWILEDW